MKSIVILTIAFVLLYSTIIPAMADQYDDAAAKCPTYECQQAIMYQKMNAAIDSGYDPMQESMKQANDNPDAWKARMEGYAYLEGMTVKEYFQAYYGNLEKYHEVYGSNTNDYGIPMTQSETQQESIVTTRTSCGEGTLEINGECVLDTNYKSTSQPSSREGTGKVSVFQKIIDFTDEPFLSIEKAVGGDGHKRFNNSPPQIEHKPFLKSWFCQWIFNGHDLCFI